MDGIRDSVRRALSAKTVGIAGAGGLGSNCAQALARAGIGRLIVVDFDAVSASNLDRQFYFLDQVGMPKVEALAANLARIDPAVAVRAVNARLDPDLARRLFSGCDAVVEALDDAGAKAMLIETILTFMPGMPLVAASGLAGWGASDQLRVHRMGGFTLVGDQSREVGPAAAPMAPRVCAVAALQANEVLELLLGPMDREDA